MQVAASTGLETLVRKVSVVSVAIGATLLPSMAMANSWRAKAVLDPQSPALCQQADVSQLQFDFSQEGTELSVKMVGGPAFSTPMSSDGAVSKTIVVPVGSKNFTVDLTGNATKRDLNVLNREHSCVFKLVPTG